MFIRTVHPNMADQMEYDENLYVVSSGYYNLKTKDLSCSRPDGRADYFLFYVLKGKSRYMMDGQSHTAEMGDVVFYNYNDVQRYEHLAKYHSQIYWVHFNGAQAPKLLQELKLTKSMKIHTESNLSRYFEDILNELTFQKKMYFKAAATDVLSILLAVSRDLEKKYSGESKVDAAISFMHSAENNRMTLEEYASVCGLSKSQFIREFRNETGMTPMCYKRSIVLNEAKWYLKHTDCSINEISRMLKFDNVYYFSNMFKKNTGISPRQYRDKKAER